MLDKLKQDMLYSSEKSNLIDNIDQELITNNKINILDAPKIEISSDQIRKKMKQTHFQTVRQISP